MIKSVLTTLTATIFYTFSFGQSIQSVSGKVINAQQEGLFGNAIILSPKDSSMVKGVSFFEGAFELSGLNDQQLLLKLTSLEFEDTYLSIEYDGRAHIELGDIIVAERQNELEEVVVVAERSLVKQNADGSVEVGVANTALASSTSVNEILSKSPGIIVDEGNEIQVLGKGAAVIFINGIRVASERLSTLSPSLIEKIEIISNPGPRYDAEGNAVINIRTKTTTDEGAKGMLKNYLSYSDFAGLENSSALDYSYSKGKWSLNSNYRLLVGNFRRIQETTRTRNVAEDFFRSELTTDWQYKMENFSNYGLGAQYRFSQNHYLSVQYTGAYEDRGGKQLSNNTIIDKQVAKYRSRLKRDDQTVKNTFSGNYFTQTDSLGSHLFVGSQYASYHSDFDFAIEQASTVNGKESNALLNNVGANNTDIFSTQADYTKVFRNHMLLELGAKFSRATIHSNTTFYNIAENGTKIREQRLSNNFNYDERVPAGYFNLKQSIRDKINYSVGLRAEYTDYELFTSVDGGRLLKDRYINVFPNASVNVKLSDDLNTYLTYSSRIIRAPYDQLNPFVLYQDAFTSIQGNPDLQPSIVHALEAGGAYRDWSIKTGYTFTRMPNDGGAFQSKEDPRVYILRRTNLSRGHGYFATVSKNLNVQWWRSINTATASYSKLIDDTGTFKVGKLRPYYYLYSQNSFAIKDWFTLYANAWYLSDKQDGINFEKDLSSVNIGIEKKLLREALVINLDLNDIFHEVRYDGEYTLGSTDIIYANTVNTNFIRLSVTYNFGRLKKLNYQNRNVGESENRRVQ